MIFFLARSFIYQEKSDRFPAAEHSKEIRKARKHACDQKKIRNAMHNQNKQRPLQAQRSTLHTLNHVYALYFPFSFLVITEKTPCYRASLTALAELATLVFTLLGSRP